MALNAALKKDSADDDGKRGLFRVMPRASQTYPHLLDIPVLREMPIDQRRALIDQCQIRHYDRPTAITAQGEPAAGMFLIARGAVEVAHVSAEGNLSILHIAGTSETIGDLHAIADSLCFCTCTALAKSTILLLPMAKLMEYAKDPLFLRGVARQALMRLNRETTNRDQMSIWSVQARLSGHLVKLSREANPIRHSQSQLAALVGCSRQTINRVLGNLRAAGMVEIGHGAIHVLQPDQLLQKSSLIDKAATAHKNTPKRTRQKRSAL